LLFFATAEILFQPQAEKLAKYDGNEATLCAPDAREKGGNGNAGERERAVPPRTDR
jgi:hypothetical protein